MSFLFKNSHRNVWRESRLQRSNAPTYTLNNNYLLIYQYIMFFKFCWNVCFLLEHVGIINHHSPCLVGTLKVFHGLLERSKNTDYN